MKKIILLLLLTISIVTLAQEPATWDYPIKPGSEEWLNIKDYSKRLELLNIPQDELTNISTNELVKICVDYPQMGLIYTKNDLLSGICYVSTLFNGFIELSKRKDAGVELLQYYKGLNPAGYSSNDEKSRVNLLNDFIVTELIISSPIILNNMQKGQRIELLKVAYNMYEEKIKHLDKLYSDQISTNLLVMAQILTIEDEPAISRQSEIKNDMDVLLQTGNANDLNFISALTDYVYSYLNK